VPPLCRPRWSTRKAERAGWGLDGRGRADLPDRLTASRGKAHSPRPQPMIGVDFGGSRIKAGLVEAGQVVRSTTLSTDPAKGPSEILDVITSAVFELSRAPKAVGVAIPGEVDSDGRCWRLPNVPGFEQVNIAKELGDRLKCPVAVENDATTAALGERLYGHGQQYPSFLMVTLGTGIGGGLVLGGQLYSGAHGFAGEIGHVNVLRGEEAWQCSCGLYGCMEAYAGTKGLLRRFRELGGVATEVLPVAESARRGEEAGLACFEMMGEALGRGLANLQNTLDLNAIVFTGGVSAAFDLVEPIIRRHLAQNTFAPPLAQVPLLKSELGERAGVIGAAYLPTL
jgi:glucokinase